MYNDVIKLIAESKTVDAYGDTVVTTTEKNVFVDVRSVGQSEFYQAHAEGFKPEIKFVLADYLDYSGQKRLQYTPFNGTAENYDIIRTFRNDNELELVCQCGVDK